MLVEPLKQLGRDPTRAALGVKHTEFIACLEGFCGKSAHGPMRLRLLPAAFRMLPPIA